MASAFCTMDTVREDAGLDRPGRGNHGEDSMKATLFVRPRYTGLVCPWTSQGWTPTSFRRCAHTAKHPYGTPRSRARVLTKQLLGSATWVDAEGTKGDYKLMKQFKGL